jgi:hypothetical protein
MIQSDEIEYIKYGLFLLRSYTATETKIKIQEILNLGLFERLSVLLNNTDNLNIAVRKLLN